MIAPAEMAILDANAAALGIPRKQLMESSGMAIAREVRSMVADSAPVTIVCGGGNNGGDGMVAARALQPERVTVALVGEPESIRTDITRENWRALERCELAVQTSADPGSLDLEEGTLVVDAMVGTGLTEPLREPARSIAIAIDEAEATVLSVDVPSGMGPGGAPDDGVMVDPDRVISFHDTKPGVESVGCPVTVADIGIPRAARRFVENGDLLRVGRSPDSHKGDNGEVLVIGGGPYAGAPAFAGMAALRAGADLVRVACPAAVAADVQGYGPSLIVEPLEGERLHSGHLETILDRAGAHDSVVIGPGLGGAEESQQTVAALLERVDGTVVVDAEALLAVPERQTEATLVCTPHQGELVRMGGPASDDWRERQELVAEFAAEIEQTTLVKGRYDIISDGTRSRVARRGTPAMTVGGTGDVLAGVVGALAATLDPFEAACVGAYITGRAGELAASGEGPVPARGDGLMADDVIATIPAAAQPEAFR